MSVMKDLFYRMLKEPEVNARVVFFIQSIGTLVMLFYLVYHFPHTDEHKQRNYFEFAGVIGLFGGVSGAVKYINKKAGNNTEGNSKPDGTS